MSDRRIERRTAKPQVNVRRGTAALSTVSMTNMIVAPIVGLFGTVFPQIGRNAGNSLHFSLHQGIRPLAGPRTTRVPVPSMGAADRELDRLAQRLLPGRGGEQLQRVERHRAVVTGALDRILEGAVLLHRPEGGLEIALDYFARGDGAVPELALLGLVPRRNESTTGRVILPSRKSSPTFLPIRLMRRHNRARRPPAGTRDRDCGRRCPEPSTSAPEAPRRHRAGLGRGRKQCLPSRAWMIARKSPRVVEVSLAAASCMTSPSAITVAACDRMSSTSSEPTSTIILKAWPSRKSPTSTLAWFPQNHARAALPRRIALIDNVIVEQRRGVHELDRWPSLTWPSPP